MSATPNPAMILAMAMQLETMLKAVAGKDGMPDYLKSSATQFVDDLKKYSKELEEAKKKIVTA